MVHYLLEVSLCWLGFYLLYALLLSQETFFKLNRFYLLSTLLLGLLIPLIELPVEAMILEDNFGFYLEPITVTVQSMEITLDEIVVTPDETSFQLFPFLIGIYLIVVSLLSIRFFYGIYTIFQLRKTGQIERKSDYYLVKNAKVHSPFSFFNYLFWSESLDLESSEKEKILTHELTHIRERHSWDVVLFEMISILFWFNPIIFLYKNSIRNIHEYLADANVLKTMHKKQYGQLLLKQLQSGFQIALANNFNHSQLKKRFTMMMKNKSSRPALLKYLWLLPIAAVMFLAFSSNTIQAQLNPTGKSLNNIEVGEFNATELEQEITALLLEYDKSTPEEKMKIDLPNSPIQKLASISNRYPEHRDELNTLIEETIERHQLQIILSNDDDKKFCLHTNPKNKTLVSNGDPIYQTVDQMPFFPGCELSGDAIEDKACSDMKMLTYVYDNINYPEEARKKGVEGTVVVRFVVDKTGKVISPEIRKSIGSGCDETVLEIIRQMPTWTPGKKNGKAANVYFNLPVRFMLENNQVASKEETSDRADVFKEVDEMPRFQGCDDSVGKEQEDCSNHNLLMFIYNNIKYPEEAREQGKEGTVVVNFVVDKDGSVILPEIVRSVGYGCDEAVLEIVAQMPKWVPGKKEGEIVKTEFNLPVKFKLADDAKPSKEKKNNQLLLKSFTASPNPTNGKVNIQFESEKGAILVEVIDLLGKKIVSISLGVSDFQGSFDTTVDLSRAAKGPAFITITQNGKKFTEKIMVQ